MIRNVDHNRIKIPSQFLNEPREIKIPVVLLSILHRSPSPFRAFRGTKLKEEHSHLRFMRVTLKAACSSDGVATTTFPPLFSPPSSLSSFLSALRANPTEEYKTITVARVTMKIIASPELRRSSRFSRGERISYEKYPRKYFPFSPPLKCTRPLRKPAQCIHTRFTACLILFVPFWKSSESVPANSFIAYTRHGKTNRNPTKMVRKYRLTEAE